MRLNELIATRRRKAHLIRGTLLTVAFAGLSVFAGFSFVANEKPAYAASSLSFSQYATHPYASKSGYDNTSTNYYTATQLCPPPSTFCPNGQSIIDMEVTADGKLITGYGDWGTNVDSFGVEAGRVGVAPLDLANGTWGSIFYSGSESMDVIRKINGYIYVPTTDPSDKAPSGGQTAGTSGYITNQTGAWSFVRNGTPTSVHTFDIATLNGTDLWTTGSSNAGVAEAKRSLDNGTTWSVAQQQTGNWMFWAAQMNGKLYTKSIDAPNARSFNGATWQDETVSSCLNSAYQPRLVVSFNNQIVCGNTNGMQVFNGTTTATYLSGISIYDYYVDGSYLYILTNSGIFRTDSLAAQPKFYSGTSTPSDARSIAVYGDHMYLGGTGKIYKSDALVSESTPLAPAQADCFVFNAGTGTITNYSGVGCSKDVVIPDTINGVTVSKIGNFAFNNKALTSVHIPGTVTTIGTNAFSDNVLSSIAIPDAVTAISDYAFRDNQLQSVQLPQALTTVGVSAFENNLINMLVLPETLTTINTRAFHNNKLTSLTIPSSVQVLTYLAFGNNELNTLTVPNLTNYNAAQSSSNVFSGNSHIQNLYVDMETVPTSIFADTNIETLHLGSSVRTLGSFAFYGNGIDVINGFDNDITSIGTGVFGGNELTSVTNPSTITNIPSSAFQNNKLTSLDIPDFVTSIGEDAFSGNDITSLVIPSSITTIAPGAFRDNNLTELIVPNTITSIGEQAFQRNQIATLVLPNSVETVGNRSFEGNPLTNLSIDMTTVPESEFSSPTGAQVRTLTIGSSVQDIPQSAFIGSLITTVIIDLPDIPANMPFGQSVTSLVLGPRVKTIGASAFQNSDLTTLTVPEGVTQIGDSAFANNPLQLIYMNGITALGEEVFTISNPTAEAAFNDCIQPLLPTLQDYVALIPCYDATFGQAEGNFTRLYTPHPAAYEYSISSEQLYASILGANPATIGGILINPVSVTMSYKTPDGTQLIPSMTKTGPNLTDYTLSGARAAKSGFTATDLPELFYQQGDALNISAPLLEGYTTPNLYNGTLSAAALSIQFVYATIIEPTTPTVTEEEATPAMPAITQPNSPSILPSLANEGAIVPQEEVVAQVAPATPSAQPITDAPVEETTPYLDERSTGSWPWIISFIVFVLALAWFILMMRRRRRKA